MKTELPKVYPPKFCRAKLGRVYEPKKVENRIYNLWLKSGFLNPDKLPARHKKPYCIVIPPPNITGELHIGHALNATIQDILIRWQRLQGKKTLWLPGADHAGIATQVVVEKELKKEGLSRFDLGRKDFIKRAWQWRNKYGNTILEQFKKLGCSLDWSRNRFTMDENYSKAVKAAFLHYYKKGWIYRGKRVINWCKRCQTSLSDLELEYRQEKGKLWYIKYPLAKISNFQFLISKQIPNPKSQIPNYITVATTRPETMLGDTAVAVNPTDKRYKNLVGKEVILPLVNRVVPIIADRLVDPKFGTGAVKVTPAHDLIDYEISLRHKLPLIQVINEEARITKEAPSPYQGLKVLEARQKVIEDLKNENLLEKTEDYVYQIPKCYRCASTIELIPSEQWFLKMNKLAKMAMEAVAGDKIHPVKSRKAGISPRAKLFNRVKFHPKSFEKGYFDWLKNIKDWCISRQIWWGHKIPIPGENDVLDTWFSAALWPFATLGWPIECRQNQKSKIKNDLAKFYPTDVLVTARDIINLWVARMIFSGMEFMKKVPFKDVYIHATVLTKEGKRMSKSLGTGIDPLNLIEKYGADATRFGICWQITGLQDIKFSEENMVAGRKFCNKLWNAARFVLIQSGNFQFPISKGARRRREGGGWVGVQTISKFQISNSKNLTPADKKILNTLNKVVASVNNDLENYRFGPALWKIYHFFWHDFCDKYIEKVKSQKHAPYRDEVSGAGSKVPPSPRLQRTSKSQKVLLYVLLASLKLLHPFLPFITEEIYQKIPIRNKKHCLMIEKWPE